MSPVELSTATLDLSNSGGAALAAPNGRGGHDAGWHPDMPMEYRNQIVTGDARDLAKRIPSESVDLVFTDPVYERIEDYVWLAEEANRVLKPNSAALIWQGQQWLEQTIVALAGGPLTYRWVLGWYGSNNMQMVGKIGRNLVPLLWYEKGNSNPRKALREVIDVPIQGNTSPVFKWSKPPRVVMHYLSRWTPPEATIWDPYSGGGTTALICKQLGLNFVGSEMDAERSYAAAKRVYVSQMPLFVETMTGIRQGSLFDAPLPGENGAAPSTA